MFKTQKSYKTTLGYFSRGDHGAVALLETVNATGASLIPTLGNELFNIIFSSICLHDKALRSPLTLNTQCLENSMDLVLTLRSLIRGKVPW